MKMLLTIFRMLTFCLFIALGAIYMPLKGVRADNLSLNFVTGVFLHDSVEDITNDSGYSITRGGDLIDQRRHVKFKYPYVLGGHLIYIAFDESLGCAQVYAQPLSSILSKGSWTRVSYVPVRNGCKTSDQFDAKPNEIKAIFSGPLVLESDRMTWRLYDIAQPEEPWMETTESIRGFLWDANASKLVARTKGLYVDNALKYPCRRVFTLDQKGNLLAVGIRDLNNKAVVCLLKYSAAGDCCGSNAVKLPGHEPKISESGQFVAIAKRAVDREWKLNIYKPNMDKKTKSQPIYESKNLLFYDLTKQEGFYFSGSYTWIGDDLFFSSLSVEGQPPVLSRVRCQSGECEPPATLNISASCVKLPWQAEGGDRSSDEISLIPIKGQLIWSPINKIRDRKCKTTNKVGDLKLGDIIWFVPFQYNGRTYIAAQAIVRPLAPDSYRDAGWGRSWLTRIVIYLVSDS